MLIRPVRYPNQIIFIRDVCRCGAQREPFVWDAYTPDAYIPSADVSAVRRFQVNHRNGCQSMRDDELIAEAERIWREQDIQ